MTNGAFPDLFPAADLQGQIELLKYRVLNLLKKRYGGEPSAIAFTSYRPGEGVSTVTSNFAVALAAENGCNVLLVDCHPHKPDLPRILRMNGDLVPHRDAADKPVLRDQSIRRVQPNLDLIVRNEREADRKRVVSIYDFNLFLQAAKIKYDFVVIDCPPLSTTGFASLLAAKVDATVLVVEAERVRRQALRRAVDQLEELGAHICGVVLNKRRYPIPQWIYRWL